MFKYLLGTILLLRMSKRFYFTAIKVKRTNCNRSIFLHVFQFAFGSRSVYLWISIWRLLMSFGDFFVFPNCGMIIVIELLLLRQLFFRCLLRYPGGTFQTHRCCSLGKEKDGKCTIVTYDYSVSCDI